MNNNFKKPKPQNKQKNLPRETTPFPRKSVSLKMKIETLKEEEKM